MRFIITSRPGPDSTPTDPEAPPDDKILSAYMAFNEEMHKAGVLIAAEGLNPSVKSARVEVRKGKRTVVDGPFTESKELIGGFYILEVPSIDEAVAWALRCPHGLGFDDVLDIRALTGEADLPLEMLEIIRTAAPTWSASFLRLHT